MSRRVAAIDCGTNSVRLLIADDAPGGPVEVERALHLTRLGQGVDATGAFAPDALARTLDAVADFARRIERAGAGRVRFVATSAARDAANRDAFFAGVRERVGVDAEVISGAREAGLSFAGALTALPNPAWPVLVMDIGGGSTELALGRPDASGAPAPTAAASLDVGAVRLRERILVSDPPTDAERAAASAFVDELLDAAGVPLGQARTWLGVGGTATSLAALHRRLPVYDRARVQGTRLDRREIDALASALLGMTSAQVAALPTMEPRRADVIGGGALIAARVAARCGVPMVACEADILDGLVAELLREP